MWEKQKLKPNPSFRGSTICLLSHFDLVWQLTWKFRKRISVQDKSKWFVSIFFPSKVKSFSSFQVTPNRKGSKKPKHKPKGVPQSAMLYSSYFAFHSLFQRTGLHSALEWRLILEFPSLPAPRLFHLRYFLWKKWKQIIALNRHTHILHTHLEFCSRRKSSFRGHLLLLPWLPSC